MQCAPRITPRHSNFCWVRIWTGNSDPPFAIPMHDQGVHIEVFVPAEVRFVANCPRIGRAEGLDREQVPLFQAWVFGPSLTVPMHDQAIPAKAVSILVLGAYGPNVFSLIGRNGVQMSIRG